MPTKIKCHLCKGDIHPEGVFVIVEEGEDTYIAHEECYLNKSDEDARAEST